MSTILYNKFLISTMQEQKQEQNQGQEQVEVKEEREREKQEEVGVNVQEECKVGGGIEELVGKYGQERDQCIGQIRQIKRQIEEGGNNDTLTEQMQNSADEKINDLTVKVLTIEHKITILNSLKAEDIELQAAQEKAEEAAKQFEPTEEDIALRMNELVQNPDESGWTDATDSQAGDNDVWVVDDEMLEQMEDSEGQGEGEGEGEGEDKESSDEEGQMNEGGIDIDDLENQFVTGEESDHQILFGKHEKFCVSVNGILSQGLLFSGGGDDYLHLYNFPKEEVSPETCLKPYHLVKHTETINKIEIANSKDFIFTMTDNEVLCTEIKTLETKPLKAKSKKQIAEDGEDGDPICSDMVCHHLGDVVAIATGFELEIYNIKGLKHFQSYYCEREINSIGFTESGKQMYVACDDNRIRLLTPKTGEFITISGIQQHQAEISAIRSKGDVIISGCIEGFVGVTNIKKGAMLALIGSKETEETNGSINHLEFAGSYFISGSSVECIDWYDLAKTKKLFHNQLEGSPTSIRWQGKLHEHVYNVSTIKGQIYLYDCRNPLKEINKTRAGNTIHDLWAEEHQLVAACEDGGARWFDVRKLI